MSMGDEARRIAAARDAAAAEREAARASAVAEFTQAVSECAREFAREALVMRKQPPYKDGRLRFWNVELLIDPEAEPRGWLTIQVDTDGRVWIRVPKKWSKGARLVPFADVADRRAPSTMTRDQVRQAFVDVLAR